MYKSYIEFPDGFKYITDCFINDPDEIAELAAEVYCVEYDIYENVNLKLSGHVDPSEIRDVLTNEAIKYANANKENYVARTILENDKGKIVNEVLVNYKDMIIDIIEVNDGSGEFDAYISGRVQEMLIEFVDQASWHINNNPGKSMIWYGLDNEGPIEPWIINEETENLDFWFSDEYDSEYILSEIGADEGCFLTWYCYECGLSTPNMKIARDKCPVDLEENMTGADVILQLSTNIF